MNPYQELERAYKRIADLEREVVRLTNSTRDVNNLVAAIEALELDRQKQFNVWHGQLVALRKGKK